MGKTTDWRSGGARVQRERAGKTRRSVRCLKRNLKGWQLVGTDRSDYVSEKL